MWHEDLNTYAFCEIVKRDSSFKRRYDIVWPLDSPSTYPRPTHDPPTTSWRIFFIFGKTIFRRLREIDGALNTIYLGRFRCSPRCNITISPVEIYDTSVKHIENLVWFWTNRRRISHFCILRGLPDD